MRLEADDDFEVISYGRKRPPIVRAKAKKSPVSGPAKPAADSARFSTVDPPRQATKRKGRPRKLPPPITTGQVESVFGTEAEYRAAENFRASTEADSGGVFDQVLDPLTEYQLRLLAQEVGRKLVAGKSSVQAHRILARLQDQFAALVRLAPR